MQQFLSNTIDATVTYNHPKLSWEAWNSELHHAFGSSRKQKYLKSVSANKVDANSIVEVQSPATLLETGVVNKREDSASQEDQVTSPTQVNSVVKYLFFGQTQIHLLYFFILPLTFYSIT